MAVREVPAEEITKTIKRLCMEASTILGDDVIEAFKRGYEREESPVGKHVFGELLENAEMAKTEGIPHSVLWWHTEYPQPYFDSLYCPNSMKRLRIQHVVLGDVAENQSLKKSSSLISSPFSLDHEDQPAYERDNCK